MTLLARAARAAAAVALLAVPAACSSKTRSNTSTSMPGTAATLRGESVATFACPSPPRSPAVESSVPASEVTEILVCGPQVPDGGRPSSDTVGSPSAHFRQLVSALSAPDLPRSRGPCPLYADVYRPVLARSATVVLLVHIPVDGCSHYQAAADTAIRAVSNWPSQG